MHNQSYKIHNTYNDFRQLHAPRDVTVLQIPSHASFSPTCLDIFCPYWRYLIRYLQRVFQNVNLNYSSLLHTVGPKDTFESMELFHRVLLASFEAPLEELQGLNHPRHVKAPLNNENMLESCCRGKSLMRRHKLQKNQMTAFSAILGL